jgi:hypothetical protein
MDIIQNKSDTGEKDTFAGMSILEILMENVDENDELGEILDTVREKAQTEDIDQNDFMEIYAQITKEQKRRTEETSDETLRAVLTPQMMTMFVKKEILRAKRYGSSFVVLGFALVSAKPETEVPRNSIPKKRLETVILNKLLSILRDSDIVGMLDKNKIGILLPLTAEGGGERTLRRCLRLMHSEPIELLNFPALEIKMAGVHSAFDVTGTTDAEEFVDSLLSHLSNLEVRVKNIQSIV